MGIEIKDFSGKLNLDNSPYKLPANDFIDALNITRNNSDVVHNFNGNELVDNPYLYTTGSTVNKVIGRREDITRNRIYFMVWNSDDYDVICYFDGATGTIVKLLQNLVDTDGVDITNFDPSYHINHIDIIYRDEGDLIYWTDGLNAPREINVNTISTYTIVTEAFIEAAKRPPLQIPVCVYGDDSSKLTNSLTKSLFQFAYRYQNDDFTNTTYSDYSELPLPVTVGTDNGIDPTKNNFITVTVETGGKNTTAIEIIARQLTAGVWSDFFKVTHLDKSDLSIGDDGVYDFKFYNDGVYPPTDINEVLQESDAVPKKAISQACANGNTIEYAATTEGYPNIPTSELSVVMTVANVSNGGTVPSLPNLTYTNIAGTFTFTVTGTITTGSYFRIIMNIAGGVGVITLCDYTSIGGDTINDVATALHAAISPTYAGGLTLNTFQALVPVGSTVLSIDHIAGSGGGGINEESIWNYNSKYHWGQIYWDKWGNIMGGVQSFVAQIDTTGDYEINTPNFSQSAGIPDTPVISAEVSHHPPTGAVKWRWVVTKNLTMGNFLYYVTDDFQDPGDGYYYFGVQNITYYQSKNTKFNYGAATVTSSTRLRVLSSVTAGAFTSDYYTQDYEVLGTETRTATGGGTPPLNDGTYIKVKIPLSVPSPAYLVNMYICLYEPVAHADNTSLEVYYGIGDTYNVIDDGGVLYHQGQTQDQTVSLPATFTFTGGDIYYHSRSVYTNLVTPVLVNFLIPDANYNDFYYSAVNGYGRPRTINVYARETFYPSRIRFSQEYQADTNINGLNRFYDANFIEIDRSYNSIVKMYIIGRELFAMQQLNTGVIPIFTQIVKDTSGNPLEANSDILLNKVRYPYRNNPGIGDTPESFAYSEGNIYFTNSNLGVVIRLGANGSEELSVVYDCNSFFIEKLAAYGKGLDNGIAESGQVYKGNPTVYGGFDNKENKYVMAFEEIKRYSDPSTLIFHQAAFTITFFDVRNSMQGFESKLSYRPEGIVSLNNIWVSFKNGQLWRHDNVDAPMNNFYGTQYPSSITPIFNQKSVIKKSQLYLGYQSEQNKIWYCADITTNTINPQTGFQQQSSLQEVDFVLEDSVLTAAILGDINSKENAQEAWIDGDFIGGNYIVVKYEISSENAATLVTLIEPYITDEIKQKNF